MGVLRLAAAFWVVGQLSLAVLVGGSQAAAAESVDLLDRSVTLPNTHRPVDFAEELAKATGVPVKLLVEDIYRTGGFNGLTFPYKVESRPVRRILWEYTLRFQYTFAFVVRRDAAGHVTAIEMTTWVAADERNDPLLLGPENARSVLDQLMWGLEHEKSGAAARALRVLRRMGPAAEEVLPELEELARGRTEIMPWGFEGTIRSISVPIQRKKSPHVPKKPAPRPELWWTQQVSLPKKRWRIDEFADAVADETGIPVTVRFEDLARDWISLARNVEFEAKDRPLADVLREFTKKWQCEWTLRCDERDRPVGIELTSSDGAYRRQEYLGKDEPTVDSVRLLLAKVRPKSTPALRRALHILGPQVLTVDPPLAPWAAEDPPLQNTFEFLRARAAAEQAAQAPPVPSK